MNTDFIDQIPPDLKAHEIRSLQEVIDPTPLSPLLKVIHRGSVSLPVIGFLDQLRNGVKQEEINLTDPDKSEAAAISTMCLVDTPVDPTTGLYAFEEFACYLPEEIAFRNETIQILEPVSGELKRIPLSPLWFGASLNHDQGVTAIVANSTRIPGLYLMQITHPHNEGAEVFCEEKLAYLPKEAIEKARIAGIVGDNSLNPIVRSPYEQY